MAVSDTRGVGVQLREVAPADAADVRHFDQLDHREQRTFLRLYRGEESPAVPLDAGEVVVFTEYYRIER